MSIEIQETCQMSDTEVDESVKSKIDHTIPETCEFSNSEIDKCVKLKTDVTILETCQFSDPEDDNCIKRKSTILETSLDKSIGPSLLHLTIGN